jgi:type II restriction/modification system DNA methylase subunit YeeA
MELHDRNSIALARTHVGVALDEAMTDVIREPLREIIDFLQEGDIDTSTSLLDDTMEECFDPFVRNHLHKAYNYLAEIA